MKQTIVVHVALAVCMSGCGSKKEDGSSPGKAGSGDQAKDPSAEKNAASSDGGASADETADEPDDVAKKPPSRAYREALREGRALAKKNDWDGAVTAFEKALAESPDEPWALSELGLALYRKGDLPRAREATLASIAAGSTPKVKAASLYNLGLIHEKLSEPEAAADAYARSLVLRDHPVVVEALARVGGDAPPQEKLVTEALEGPMTSIDEACAAMGGGDCKVATAGDADDAKEPFEEVTTYALLGSDEWLHDEFACGLAIKTERGWFVSDTEVFDDLCDVAAEFSIAKMAFIDRKGKSRVVAITSETYLSSRYADYHEVKTIVCGVAKSGTPSCTVPILVRGSYVDLYGDVESDDGEWEEVETDVSYQVSIDGGANAIVIGKGHPLAGRHAIAFP